MKSGGMPPTPTYNILMRINYDNIDYRDIGTLQIRW